MALENVGDYSATPVISTSGVHIIYYYEDVPAGAVPLDEVRDALYDQTLETVSYTHLDVYKRQPAHRAGDPACQNP